MQLKPMLLSFAQFNDNPELSIAKNETITTNGLAISLSSAALCLDDFIRTVTFIRDMNEAINDFLKLKNHAFEVLYVDCGPLAPLIIPYYMFSQKNPFTSP